MAEARVRASKKLNRDILTNGVIFVHNGTQEILRSAKKDSVDHRVRQTCRHNSAEWDRWHGHAPRPEAAPCGNTGVYQVLDFGSHTLQFSVPVSVSARNLFLRHGIRYGKRSKRGRTALRTGTERSTAWFKNGRRSSGERHGTESGTGGVGTAQSRVRAGSCGTEYGMGRSSIKCTKFS